MPTLAGGQTILNAIRSTINSSGAVIDYANRIPEATQDNLQDVGKALFNYEPAMNEFLNQLINRIGLVYIHDKLYSNKLSILKKGKLEFGDSIEEIFVDLARAIQYYPEPATGNEADVYKQYKPQIVSAFHKVNRENTYPITINNDILKRAFTNYANFDRFVGQIFNSVYKADEVDEYILFKQLIGSTLRNSKLVQVTKPIATDKSAATQFSIVMRSYALALEYMSREYNQAGVATNTDLADQILVLRSDIVPVIDVLELANAFNMNLAKPISGRIIVIDDFGSGNDDLIGGIIDKDISMIWDTVYRTDSIYNPKHMYWNFFLHHHQIIASSPFANAVGFTTEAITNSITSVTINPNNITIPKGYSGDVKAYVEYTGTPDTTVTWSITGAKSSATKVVDGTIYVGADESATTLTVKAETKAVGENPAVSGTATVTVIDGSEN